MIGGQDILIGAASGAFAMDCAIRTIRLFWPHAVFENGTSAEVARSYQELRFSNLREVLAYKNFDAFKKWEELGAEPSLDGTMIHLLASENRITLVIDDAPAPEIMQIVQTIRHAIHMNSFDTRRTPEAA